MSKQFSSPIVLNDLVEPFKPKRLARLSSVASASIVKFPEKLIQELVHADPGILPVEELDRSFMDLRAVCQELSLASGAKYVDNLLINPDGRICIVECKLWRNPQAVREVIAQVLDYAAELSRLSYSQLEGAAAKAKRQDERDFLVRTVLGDGASEEQKVAFIDALSLSLRNGTFLLLIVGDGIRPGLQQIADLLNRSTLGVSLGLIEMAFYGDGDIGPYYVQPRLLFKTETVTRTIFVLADKQGKLSVEDVSEAVKLPTLSEQEFFQKLKAIDSNFPAEVAAFIDSAEAVGCFPELKRTYVIYAEGFGQTINLGGISSRGTVTIWGSAVRDEQIGFPVGLDYMNAIVDLFPGAEINKSSAEPGNWYVRYKGRSSIPLRELLSRKSDWISAIAKVAERLQQAQV